MGKGNSNETYDTLANNRSITAYTPNMFQIFAECLHKGPQLPKDILNVKLWTIHKLKKKLQYTPAENLQNFLNLLQFIIRWDDHSNMHTYPDSSS